MYIKLLSVIAIIEIAGGTIFSVLGIIKMSFKDVVATQTCIAFDTVDESNLLQRYYARCGIAYILVGSLLQILLIFYVPVLLYEFLIILFLSFSIPTIIYLEERNRYKTELVKIRKHKEIMK